MIKRIVTAELVEAFLYLFSWPHRWMNLFKRPLLKTTSSSFFFEEVFYLFFYLIYFQLHSLFFFFFLDFSFFVVCYNNSCRCMVFWRWFIWLMGSAVAATAVHCKSIDHPEVFLSLLICTNQLFVICQTTFSIWSSKKKKKEGFYLFIFFFFLNLIKQLGKILFWSTKHWSICRVGFVFQLNRLVS